MKTLHITALILTIIGALNWGVIALFDINLVETIFGGETNLVTRIIYGLVGLAGLVNIGLLVDLFDRD